MVLFLLVPRATAAFTYRSRYKSQKCPLPKLVSVAGHLIVGSTIENLGRGKKRARPGRSPKLSTNFHIPLFKIQTSFSVPPRRGSLDKKGTQNAQQIAAGLSNFDL